MREKVLHGIFSVFSAVMWIFTLASLVFGVVLIAAAPDKAPDVTVKSAVITPVSADDPTLAANGKSGGNWYRIDADVRLAANKYSPWTLEADALTVRGWVGSRRRPGSTEGGGIRSRLADRALLLPGRFESGLARFLRRRK